MDSALSAITQVHARPHGNLGPIRRTYAKNQATTPQVRDGGRERQNSASRDLSDLIYDHQ